MSSKVFQSWFFSASQNIFSSVCPSNVPIDVVRVIGSTLLPFGDDWYSLVAWYSSMKNPRKRKMIVIRISFLKTSVEQRISVYSSV